MKDRLISFLDKYPYPASAKAELCSALERLEPLPDFITQVRAYDSGEDIDWLAAMDGVRAAAERAGVHEYTAKLLFSCLLAEPLRRRYLARGIDEGVWYDTMRDLYVKYLECMEVEGVCGSFVAYWFGRLFDLRLFALGRLEFEPAKFTGASRTLHGVTLEDGVTDVLNVHIPSGGRLPHGDVLDAYKRAYAFFPQFIQNGVLPLRCSSWMLYPGLEQFLPESSNIIRFKRDYTLTVVNSDTAFKNCWRLYGVRYAGDPKALPRDSSLRRGYADWIAAGGTPGTAVGFALFDGEKIIKTP